MFSHELELLFRAWWVQIKKKDEANFRYTICDIDFSSRITLNGYYNKHKREKVFEAPF
jgi:hypothetical protein